MAGRMGYVLFLLHLARRTKSADVCFFPDGKTIAEGHVPCPGVNASSPGPCCNRGDGEWPHVDTCMSNGYCFSVNYGLFYRGSCADRGWGPNSGCPVECLNVNSGGPAKLAPCSDNQLCCTAVEDDANNDCCAKNSFPWNDATFDGPLNASTLLNVTDVRGTIAGLSSGSDSAATATITQTPGKTFSVGAIAGVGAGLGVPLLIALATIGYLAFALNKERRAKRAARETSAALTPSSDGKNPDPYRSHPGGFAQPPFYPQQVQQVLPGYTNPVEKPTSPAVGGPVELGIEREPQEVASSR